MLGTAYVELCMLATLLTGFALGLEGIGGLYHSVTGNATPGYNLTPPNWNSTNTHPQMA